MKAKKKKTLAELLPFSKEIEYAPDHKPMAIHVENDPSRLSLQAKAAGLKGHVSRA